MANFFEIIRNNPSLGGLFRSPAPKPFLPPPPPVRQTRAPVPMSINTFNPAPRMSVAPPPPVKPTPSVPMSRVPMSVKPAPRPVAMTPRPIPMTRIPPPPASPNRSLSYSFGQTLQRTPSITSLIPSGIKTRARQTFRPTETENQAMKFIINLPSDVARGWGESLDLLSTAEGKEVIKTGMKQLPQDTVTSLDQVSRKEYLQALGTLVSNPAVSTGLDASDFIPGVGFFVLGIKTAGKKALKQGLQKQKLSVIPTQQLKESQGVSPTRIAESLSSGSNIPQKTRKFVTSVKDAPNVTDLTKGRVKGLYTPKPNIQLKREARALLESGVTLDLKKVKDVDQTVAAAIQEAINLDSKGNHQAAANLFNNLAEQATELGRGVQAHALLAKMSPEAISLSAAGKINKYNETAIRKIPQLTGQQQKTISDMVDVIQNMPAGREKNIAINKLNTVINEFIPSSIADKVMTVWKAGLLTSLRTHERNLIGNTIHHIAEIAKDVPASIADRILSLRTGKRSTTFTLGGELSGAKKGLLAGKDVITKGFDPEATIEAFDVRRINWGKNPIEQVLKVYTEGVFRTLAASDKPFYHAAFGRSLYDQAKVTAINAGKSGDKSFIKSLIENPTTDMLKMAAKDAEVATFKNKTLLGRGVTGLKNLGEHIPGDSITANIGRGITKVIGEGLAPFTSVPSSIAGQMVAYSPIGLLRGIVDAGEVLARNVPNLQRQASQEIGRGVMGTGLMGIGAYLYQKGLMTGQPKDAADKRTRELQNIPDNSVWFNGKWRNINSVGPESLVLLAGAKAQEEFGQGGEKNAGRYGASLAKDFLGQTFLRGVQGPLNAVNDPDRYGQSYVGGQAASTIPNLLKDFARSGDKYQRENNTISDYFTNSLPGLRNQGVIKRDVLGNPLPQEQQGIAAFIDLFNSRTPVSNTVVNELSRLNKVGFNATPGDTHKTQTFGTGDQKQKVDLTPEQLGNFNKVVGTVAVKILDKLLQSEAYKQLSDQDKSGAIDKVMQEVRTRVRESTTPDKFNSKKQDVQASPTPAPTPTPTPTPSPQGGLLDVFNTTNPAQATAPESKITEKVITVVPAAARPAAQKSVPLIEKALKDEGIDDPKVLAYALATIEHETAGTFEPIEEIQGRQQAIRLGYGGGEEYFGRGFIQLTHLENYQKIGERIGVPELADNPELALDPEVSAKILAAFFKDNGVADLVKSRGFVAARTPVNPDDKGPMIAQMAERYLASL